MTDDGGPQELGFQPRLFTNATHKKAVAAAELYKQLKRLSKELNGLEQETVDTQSLDAVTKQLVEPALLRHKEPGVVAYVSCCIADVLRLYAPEAPYSDGEIKQIFSAFIDQLQLLGDSSSQFFPLREYLLTSLATVRTPALVAMQPDAEDIISRFFTVLFGVVGGSQAHSIQMQILDVLQQLVEEPKAVPQDVVDVILLQFTKRRQQDNPAAHQLASDLATGTADVLQKYIYQYFNDVIVSAAQSREAGGSLDDLRAAHNLILELNKAAPGTLLNVVPQLEEELSVEDVDIRVLATGVVGQMLADKGFTLAKRYDSTWKAWKGRRADAAAVVRAQWVERAVALYQHQPQLARELNDCVAEKLRDVDERVRQAACHALGLLEMGGAVQDAVAEQVVAALGERCRDRKAAVRSEAIIALATLYGQAYEEVEQGDAAARQKWGGIPSTIFLLRYVNDPDVDSKVESILTGAILGFARIKDDGAKCRRLLTVFAGLTAKAQSGFFGYMRRQRDIIRLVDPFLALCGERGAEPEAADGSVEQRLQQLSARIGACFPEKARLEAALVQLAELHDGEVYDGLRATMDAKSDIKSVRKFQKSALKRLASLAPSLLDATAPLWKCVGLTTINRVLVPFLIEHAAAGDPLRGAADALLAYIADVFPEMLRLSGAELFEAAGLQSRNVAAVEERLALMVKFAKAVPKSVPPGIEDRLAALVRTGSVRQAKYAAFLLTQAEGAAALCATLAGELADDLDAPGRRAPVRAALSRFALRAPAAFAPHAERVVRGLVSDVLAAAHIGGVDDAEWQPRETLDDAEQARVYAVKALANWLVGMDAKALTRDTAQMVLGALRQLVRSGGAAQRSVAGLHVLLAAASCTVKVAAVPRLERAVGVADMLRLAAVVQDPCYEVRSAFLLHKLIPALVARRIHARFIALVFLAAHDVEPVVRDNVRHAVEQRLAQFRPTPGAPSAVEESLCRFLYILAHHPDWDDSQPVPTLELFAPYIEFYISCVCTAQSVSLLFCYAGEIKAYRGKPAGDMAGAESDVFATRLYVLSELAQYLLREKSMSANWPVNVYPARLTLPDDLFEPLSDADKAAVPRKPFLDAEYVALRAKAPAAARAAKRNRPRPRPAAALKRARAPARGAEPAADSDSDAMDVALSGGSDDDGDDGGDSDA